MKLYREKVVFFTLLVLLISGCKKNHSISEKQAILFQFDYINYAWGFSHHGFIIDYEGKVLAYNNPEIWNFPDDNLAINSSQMNENISMCIQTGLIIPKDELQKYVNYIQNIALSKVTAQKNVAADAGSLKYICYRYSESNEMYRGSLIKMEGDFSCENLNFYSKKVVEWLKNIQNKIPED